MAKKSKDDYFPIPEDRIKYIVEPPDPEREKRKKFVEELFKREEEKATKRKRKNAKQQRNS